MVVVVVVVLSEPFPEEGALPLPAFPFGPLPEGAAGALSGAETGAGGLGADGGAGGAALGAGAEVGAGVNVGVGGGVGAGDRVMGGAAEVGGMAGVTGRTTLTVVSGVSRWFISTKAAIIRPRTTIPSSR